MSDEVQKNILTEIRARHEQDQRWRNGPSMICPHAHDDRGWLLSEIERLRARVKVLERDDRLPRPPEELVGALNDRIHPASGRLLNATPIHAKLKEAKP